VRSAGVADQRATAAGIGSEGDVLTSMGFIAASTAMNWFQSRSVARLCAPIRAGQRQHHHRDARPAAGVALTCRAESALDRTGPGGRPAAAGPAQSTSSPSAPACARDAEHGPAEPGSAAGVAVRVMIPAMLTAVRAR
jgi:hypothetical protein